MKVVLTKDVKELGKTGDVVNVAEGHARNFLIPKKLAIVADAGALKTIEAKKKMMEEKGEKILSQAQQTAEKIDNLKVTISGKQGSGTKLYGSVTSQEIADNLNSQHGIKIDKRKIHLVDPIKNTGSYEVPVKLHTDVSATIHVDVVPAE